MKMGTQRETAGETQMTPDWMGTGLPYQVLEKSRSMRGARLWPEPYIHNLSVLPFCEGRQRRPFICPPLTEAKQAIFEAEGSWKVPPSRQ